jgi:hypothetical protein
MINENWVWKNWATKAVTMDCNDLVPMDVDLVINTSTEHFESKKWFENIPVGTIVALQSNNMEHDTHISNCRGLDDFLNEYPLTEILYKGTLAFEYPDWKFERYMVIGQK